MQTLDLSQRSYELEIETLREKLRESQAAFASEKAAHERTKKELLWATNNEAQAQRQLTAEKRLRQRATNVLADISEMSAEWGIDRDDTSDESAELNREFVREQMEGVRRC